MMETLKLAIAFAAGCALVLVLLILAVWLGSKLRWK